MVWMFGRVTEQIELLLHESMKVPLKECLMKAKYYSILQDGSTDTSVSEQELIYVLFLYESQPILKFLHIENPPVADAQHLVECVKRSFSSYWNI